jgi:hypothetical protein
MPRAELLVAKSASAGQLRLRTSWTAGREAEEAAWDAPGVVDVVNRLTVRP